MISIAKKFLFVHTPKTGGNSVQNILKSYSEDEIFCKADYQDGVERFSLKSNHYPRLIKHSNLLDYKKSIPSDVYDQLFKFSITRNPWDRMVSRYFSPHRSLDKWDRDLFVKIIKQAPTLNFYVTVPDGGTWIPKKVWKIIDKVELVSAKLQEFVQGYRFLDKI